MEDTAERLGLPLEMRVLSKDEAEAISARSTEAQARAMRLQFLRDTAEKVGAKIRDAEMQKVPYMFVVGAREAETGEVSVRKHGTGDMGSKKLDEVIEMLSEEVESKGLAES